MNKTGKVHNFDWNHHFPIKYIQHYRFNRVLNLLGRNKYSTFLELATSCGVFTTELAQHWKNYMLAISIRILPIYRITPSVINVSNNELKSQSIEKTTYPDNLLDAILALFSIKKLEEEFWDYKIHICKTFEQNFKIIKKVICLLYLGSFFLFALKKNKLA